jgi:hypothetical protein
MDVTVSIVSYNTRDLLRECLRSIYEESKSVAFEVFVVDNDSRDGSAEMVEREFPAVNLIRSPENVGFARGNNMALRKAGGRYFLLLNPDTRLVNDAIGRLVEYMDGHPRVGGAGSMLLEEDRSVQTVCRKFSRVRHEVGELMPILNRFRMEWLSRDYLPGQFDYRSTGETDYVQGACLIVRREAAEEVGLLDERFFMYSEEEDWCFRLKRAGWKVMYVPDAVIVHYRGMSTRQRSNDMLQELYRSKLKFFAKNYGAPSAGILRAVLVGLMAIRIPYYGLLPLVFRGKREEARRYRDQSLTILRAMGPS